MKISEKWLRTWVNPTCDTTTLLQTLTMAGLEVEGSEPAGWTEELVVVAEVIAIEPHPDAKKLQVCQVKIGSQTLQIVCGASNVAVGVKVPAALVGAKLPPDLSIKAAQLRGVDSFGMLCSATELGLTDSSEGLLLLPADAPIGMSLKDYLELDDTIIDINLTPNRGDCLSVAGIAREVAALTHTPLTAPAISPVTPTITTTLPVELAQTESCPLYIGRVIKGINAQAITPLWMKEKLRRCGLRSIHPVVDVTNYVMLELGQPMHAFDLQHINSGITVRLAKKDEKLTTLDGVTLNLTDQTLVIADQQQPLALAGIMGGLASAVTQSTTDIFLESAFFVPKMLAGKARSYGLHTDSSHRFERGVNPQLAKIALERATSLLLNLVGGQPGPIIEKIESNYLPKQIPITVRLKKINQILGTDITAAWVSQNLSLLGFELKALDEASWEVTAPSYRFDTQIEADIIEEVARLYGYDHIDYVMPTTKLAVHPRPEATLTLRVMKQILVARDYYEAITYSFVAPAMQKLLDPHTQAYALLNPISPELSVMRTSIWPGLMTAYLQNAARQAPRVRLFESGACFKVTETEIQQQTRLAGLAAGLAYPEQWGLTNRPVDFFDMKKDIEVLLALRHDGHNIKFVPANIPALHPGRSAIIEQNGQIIGYLGEIHPQISAELDLRQPVYLFECILDQLVAAQLPQFATLSKYPSIRRDIAVVVEQTVPIDAFKQTFMEVFGDLLTGWQLFDVYVGKNIEQHHRSLAFGLTLQHQARTLTDGEVAELMETLTQQLSKRFNAVLRE